MNKENQWFLFYVIICVCQDASIFAYQINLQSPSPTTQQTTVNQQTTPLTQTPTPTTQQTTINLETTPLAQTPSPTTQQTTVNQQTTSLTQTPTPTTQQTTINQETTPLAQTPSPTTLQTTVNQQTTSLTQTPTPTTQQTTVNQQTTSLTQTPSPTTQQTTVNQKTTSLTQTPTPTTQQTTINQQTTPLNQQTTQLTQTPSPTTRQTTYNQQTTQIHRKTSQNYFDFIDQQKSSIHEQTTLFHPGTKGINQNTSTQPSYSFQTSTPSLSKDSLQTTTYSLSTTDASNSKDYMDVVIMLDASGSLGVSNFQKTLKFVNSVVDQVDVESGFVRIGILKYSTSAKVVFHLNRFNTTVDIKARVSNIYYDDGMTNPASGILLATNNMFQTENGDRPNVDNILILMTDGASNTDTWKTIPAANAAKGSGIRIITIGVGVSNYTEMVMVSSKPLEENQYIFKSFDDLKYFVVTFFNITDTVEAVEEQRSCKCPCTLVGSQKHVNMTVDELHQAIAELKAELVVNKTSLSSFIYKKKSAPDSRSSSQNIGIVGAVFLSVPFVVLFIFDMLNLYQYFIR